MTRYRNRVTMFCPNARRDEVNTALGDAEGFAFGPGNMSVELKKGNSPITTHLGCSAAFTDEELAAIRALNIPGLVIHNQREEGEATQGKRPSEHFDHHMNAGGYRKHEQ